MSPVKKRVRKHKCDSCFFCKHPKATRLAFRSVPLGLFIVGLAGVGIYLHEQKVSAVFIAARLCDFAVDMVGEHLFLGID